MEVARPAAAGRRAASRRSRSSASRRSSSAASSSRARSPRCRRLERLAHLVGALPDRAALLGRQLADRAEHLGQRAPCGRGSAPAAPRARPARPPRPIAASASLPELVEVGTHGSVRHGAAILLPSSYSATVAAMATLSESGPPVAQRDARRCGAPARAARPGSPSRSAPRQTHERRAAVQALDLGERALRRARRARAACRGARRGAPRPGGRAKTEPMLARTALGENGSAQPGPSSTGPSQSAWAERRIGADVAGVVHGVQVDHHAARRAPTSAAGYTPITRVPEPSELTVVAGAAAPRPRPARSSSSGSQPAAAAASTRSSPSALNRPSLSRQRRSLELADRLQLFVVG